MNTITQSVVSVNVEAARIEAASAQVRGYGAIREYSLTLNEHFDGLSVAWFTIEHNAKGAEAEMIHAEKRAFFKVLHEKHPKGKYPNPSTVWARVRQAGQEELELAFGGGEAEADSATEAEGSDKARHTKSLTLRYVDELTTLFKAGKRAERDGIIQTKEAEALVHIASGLGALGIDISQL
jgi:hypothetical protein